MRERRALKNNFEDNQLLVGSIPSSNNLSGLKTPFNALLGLPKLKHHNSTYQKTNLTSQNPFKLHLSSCCDSIRYDAKKAPSMPSSYDQEEDQIKTTDWAFKSKSLVTDLERLRIKPEIADSAQSNKSLV